LFLSQEKTEYINGVLTVALVLVCFFLIWAIILVVLMCMGRRRVGFLSGVPYQMHLADTTEPNPRIRRGRIVFALSGMIFITFTFLLLFLGIANLSETTVELANGARVCSRVVFVMARFLLITSPTPIIFLAECKRYFQRF
jgi:drug/metabolite transporter (DMT)-like permease